MHQASEKSDGSPSRWWRVKHWFWGHVGLFILGLIVILYFYAPETAVAILDANMAMVRRVAKWIAAVVPSAYGGSILISVIQLMDTITSTIKDVTQSKLLSQQLGIGPQTEIFFRMFYEGVFLYVEIKVVRFLFAWILYPIVRRIARIGRKAPTATAAKAT